MVLEKKVHKFEVAINYDYKEALIFNVGQVCTLAGDGIRESFYILKGIRDRMFHKVVQKDNSVMMYVITEHVC